MARWKGSRGMGRDGLGLVVGGWSGGGDGVEEWSEEFGGGGLKVLIERIFGASESELEVRIFGFAGGLAGVLVSGFPAFEGGDDGSGGFVEVLGVSERGIRKEGERGERARGEGFEE